MPSLIITAGAALGLERCRKFLQTQDRPAAVRAGQVISKYLTVLEARPQMGRPLDDESEMRELVIPFGDSGYVALYRFDPTVDRIYVLAFRHQKEAGF